MAGVRRVLLPTPSWPNHPAILKAAKLDQIDAPYFDGPTQRIDFDRLIDRLDRVSAGDAVLLQACCNNPLGADFTLEQWDVLAGELAKRGLIAFLDLAYQGLGDGIEEDVAGLRRVMAAVPEAIVTISESKTFGVYRERVGALYVKSEAKAREAVSTNIFALTRAFYSMPPDHGAALVRIVLSDPVLYADWADELKHMRARMNETRKALAAARINSIAMNAIADQNGMFTTLPLSLDQITNLRVDHAVHMTEAGRVNIAGLRQSHIPRFVEALSAVVN
jgi:aromatic-amino-acid transaminase